jgi:hypothetical protein
MAGSAAVALLVLAAIDDSLLGMVYLGLFGIGTITSMIAATCLMTIPITILVDRTAGSRRWLAAVSGVATLIFGAVMVHGLGGPLALLAADPAFLPR